MPITAHQATTTRTGVLQRGKRNPARPGMTTTAAARTTHSTRPCFREFTFSGWGGHKGLRVALLRRLGEGPLGVWSRASRWHRRRRGDHTTRQAAWSQGEAAAKRPYSVRSVRDDAIRSVTASKEVPTHAEGPKGQPPRRARAEAPEGPPVGRDQQARRPQGRSLARRSQDAEGDSIRGRLRASPNHPPKEANTVKTVQINYDLRKPGRNYQPLYDYIKSFSAYAKPLQS